MHVICGECLGRVESSEAEMSECLVLLLLMHLIISHTPTLVDA